MAVDRWPAITLHRPLNYTEIRHHLDYADDTIARVGVQINGVWFGDDGHDIQIIPTSAFIDLLDTFGIKFTPKYLGGSIGH